MIPYAKHLVTQADEVAVIRALRSSHLTQGPMVEQFEEALADLAGARYAVAVNSGTAALHLAYTAVSPCEDADFLVPALSFVATANAVHSARVTDLQIGLHFLDIDPRTGLMHVGIPDRYDVVVPVTLGGQPVTHLAYHYEIVVDACHGPLVHMQDAQATCFSFHPCKHVAAGEGGAIVTNDEGLAQACRTMRSHGRVRGRMHMMGWNYRMPDLNAALALSQLHRYHENVAIRRMLASRYDAAFAGRVDTVPHSPESARHLYQLLIEHRDAVQAKLLAAGIQTAVHYPVIPHEPFYGRTEHYPGAEWHAAHTLSIPLYPSLDLKDQDYVIERVLEAVCG